MAVTMCPRASRTGDESEYTHMIMKHNTKAFRIQSENECITAQISIHCALILKQIHTRIHSRTISIQANNAVE